MSNNLVSQHLPMESIQVGQLGYIPSKMDTSTEVGLMRPGVEHSAVQHIPQQNLQMGMVGAGLSDMAVTEGVSMYQASHLGSVTGSTDIVSQIPVSNYQVNMLGSVAGNPVSQNPIRSNAPMVQIETQLNNKVQEQQTLFHGGLRDIGSMHQLQQPSMLTKRKSPTDSASANAAAQKLSMPNKRMVQLEHRPWLQPPQLKLPSQTQSPRNSTGSPRTPALATSKRSPNVAGLQPHQAAPRRPVPSKAGQMAASPKVKNDSFDSVRSKMRESLASALALVVENKSSSSGASDEKSKDPQNKLSQEKSQSGQASAELKEGLNAREIKKYGDNQNDSHGILKSDGSDFQPTVSLCDEDVSFSDSFFVKDDLLQGNGLSWVLESDVGLTEKKGVESEPTQHPAHQEDACNGNRAGQVFETPENLATNIEAELFKLFGGVNKKYKEKGRSLLFNLKDRNNPELRERVMSGEIPPERLCSMTAEELASKELSQWRIAKAEELAQMVVLPDTQVDIRRLVRKTHKGEFQVEIEEPVSLNMGAVGTSVPMGEEADDADKKNKPKVQEASGIPEVDSSKEKSNATKAKSNAADGNTNSVKQDASYTVTIPSSEATDLMQGLMVDDELKDAEFLPPILSLDEFMESLDSEPPFENLPKEAEGSASGGDNLDPGREAKSPDVPPETPVDTTSDKPDEGGRTNVKPDVDGKPLVESPVKSAAALLKELKGERFWDGELQLNISALAPVIGIFKSGEKTSANEWPSLIEVKGRVRLDAFGKFLQDLPMSRSRAVMAVYFICKDGTSESDRANLREVADSYVSDERVGFAEPVSGVELYVCPPHGNTREMLGKVLPKDQLDSLDSLDCGLIGVVVWRKVTTVSPKSSTHHKHNSKRQHVTPRRHREKDTSVSLTSEHPSSRGGPAFTPKTPSQPEEDVDDDELPPGFGPPGSQDEDDLPEFNFSSGPATPRPLYFGQNPARGSRKLYHDQIITQPASRPVDSIRELIHKYGQPENKKPQVNYQERRGLGVAVQPWNDDEDDDMPEWRPEESLRHQPPLQPPLYAQQPQLLRPPMGHNMVPAAPAHTFPAHQPQGGQFYGTSPGYGAARQGGAAHWPRGAR